MNCDKIKNLLSEHENLADLSRTPDISAHLKNCKSCQAAFKYEEKLRQSFTSIAAEAPPPDLAAKIMAIQAEQLTKADNSQTTSEPGWFSQLLAHLQGFPFKIAFTAGLTGFLVAVLMLRQPHLVSTQKPDTVATRQEQAEPSPAEEKTIILAMKADNKNDKTAGDSAQAGITRRSVQSESVDSLVKQNKAEIQLPATEKDVETESLSEERIPGAMTFALDSSEDSFVTESSTDSDDISALAKQPATSEPEIELAMAPAESRELAKSAVPSAPTRFAAPPPVANIRARLSASQTLSESRSKKLEQNDEESSSDPLADELRELIENNGIDLTEGFISLDELAMRGYLPAEKLRHLRPPTGSGWYLQKTAGKLRIFLKKR